MSDPTTPSRRFRPVPVFGVLAAAVTSVLALGLLTGCSAASVSAPVAAGSDGSTGTTLTVVPDIDYSSIVVDEDVVYSAVSGQTLDVCSPPTAATGTDSASAGLPVVVSVHGGSWTRGDKANADWRPLCTWFASEGFITVSVNYRLTPSAVFPAQIDDVSAAIAWLRDPATVAAYGIDPTRIAVFGGSAGGNLAALAGTRGSGSLTTGSRVAAVVELSGPVDLTEAGMADDDPAIGVRGAALAYLGCTDLASCPAAAAASAATYADPSDPPFFIAHSTEERVALSQSEDFAGALEAAGVRETLRIVPGALHSIAMLDDSLRAEILTFLRTELDVPEPTEPTESVLAIDGSVG